MTLISFAFLSFEENLCASGWSEKQDLAKMGNDVSSPLRSVFSIGKKNEMTEDERKRTAEIAKSRLAESIRRLDREKLEHYDPSTAPLPPSIAREIRRETISTFPIHRTLAVLEG